MGFIERRKTKAIATATQPGMNLSKDSLSPESLAIPFTYSAIASYWGSGGNEKEIENKLF